MSTIRKTLAVAGVVCLSLLLAGCGFDYGDKIIGTWKDVSQERYLTIERLPSENASALQSHQPNLAANPTGIRYQSVIYAPTAQQEGNREGSTEGASQVVSEGLWEKRAKPTLNHRTLPSVMHDGILMLKVDAGSIPVLYDPVSERIVLNGTEEFRRVPDDLARRTLGSLKVADAKVANTRAANH